MNNKLKALSLGVSAAVVASGSVIAANGNVNLGGGSSFDLTDFTVDNSTGTSINLGNGGLCGTAGWTCSAIATDAGYQQRQITNGTDTYIQSVVAEGSSVADQISANAGATGGVAGANTAITFDDLGFVDSTMVKMNNGNSMAQVGRVAEVHINLEVEVQSSLRKGAFWTHTDIADGSANLVFNQTIAGEQGGSGTSNTLFFSSFQFQEVASDMGASSTSAGKILRVAQLAGESLTSKQEFRMSRYNNSSFNTVAPYAFYNNAMVVGGDTVIADPAAGELEVLWLGQNFGSGAMGTQIIAGPVGAAGNDISVLKFGRTGFSATGAAQSGFDWNSTVSGTNPADAVYAPKF